ncbi:hypothetical protein J2S02_001035 [Metabacillus niabensis]|uniref:Uncharacterized protein n=1 Tax=Metabacillus niabensis TaxID=324854 RepID=A0ABT9YYM0_9BACI|nr:hypothetical protein [Metabacillus niabensis]
MKKPIQIKRGLSCIELFCFHVYLVILISLFSLSRKIAVSEATKILFNNQTADACE